MAYQLSLEINRRIDAHLALGGYKTPDEVLSSALDALERQNADQASIQRGIDDENAGRLRPFRDVDRDMRTQYGVSTQE